MSADEAKYAAQREFGGVEQIEERCREQRSWAWLAEAARDLKYGARQLRRTPGFAIVAILTLATAAIFRAFSRKPSPFLDAR